MTNWHDYLKEEGRAPAWPYPIRYDKEQEVNCDVLVVGGGIAGCWAAISAARSGLKVVLVEKGDVIRSGSGGPGCDHWCNAPANPLSNVDPDEWAEHMADRPYCNGIGIQIQNREDWDTLLEMEQMGGKIRDTGDEYVGAQGRDPKSKIMISPRYGIMHSYMPVPEKSKRKPLKSNLDPENNRNNVVIRIWGSTFKPALKKECKRLGVQIFDRTMITRLLNDKGISGARVVGALGFNSRTGEFYIFKAKATILSTGGSGWIWNMNSELAGMSTMYSRTASADGNAMAWFAGAAITGAEGSILNRTATGFKHKWYTGAGDASYENVPLVDSNGKRMPLPIQGWEDAGAMLDLATDKVIREGIAKGEWSLPVYGDFPAMSDVERRVTWNMMLGEESTVKIIIDTFNKAGFDPSRDLLQSFKYLELDTPPKWRDSRGGGLVVDWNLKTTVDGLYAAGTQTFNPEDHAYCAATGRYAGRKAAAYAKEVSKGEISRDQISKEKARVYAPTKRAEGLEWKELHAGFARAMQYYCSEHKTEHLLKMGLGTLQKIETESVPLLYALDPHKLMRTMEDLSMLTYAQIIVHSTLARQASSMPLGLQRIDFPALDPPEWNKFLTIRLEDGVVKHGELPMRYWGDMKKNYEVNNQDYQGVWRKE